MMTLTLKYGSILLSWWNRQDRWYIFPPKITLLCVGNDVTRINPMYLRQCLSSHSSISHWKRVMVLQFCIIWCYFVLWTKIFHILIQFNNKIISVVGNQDVSFLPRLLKIKLFNHLHWNLELSWISFLFISIMVLIATLELNLTEMLSFLKQGTITLKYCQRRNSDFQKLYPKYSGPHKNKKMTAHYMISKKFPDLIFYDLVSEYRVIILLQ